MKTSAWMIAVLSLLVLSPAKGQDSLPNLTGKWILNEKMSDDLGQVMREARDGARERPQGGGGRGGGRGGGGGRRGGGDDHRAERQERMEKATEAYARLEIHHEDLELNVTDGVDITRLLYTDGRQTTIWTQRGEARATANWQGPILVVELTSPQEDALSTRRYALSDEGRQLTLEERISVPGRDEPIELTMVYDLKN